MRIAVTGAEGFIGSALRERLVRDGMEYVGIDRKLYQEVETFARSGGGFDAIVHLAAQTSVWNRDFKQLVNDNISCFIDMVEYSNRTGCRLVYASSSCSENITSMYGMTKRFDEQFAGVYAYNAIGVRFHNVYGANPRCNTLLAVVIERSRDGKALRLYNNGMNVRHFTYIDDIVEGVMRCLRSDKKGIVNICNPQRNTTLEFVREAAKYIPIEYETVDEVRMHDKEDQRVSGEVIEMDYTSIEDGVRKSLI